MTRLLSIGIQQAGAILLTGIITLLLLSDAFPYCQKHVCRSDLENQGRRTRKCFLFVDRIPEGFEMNKLKKLIENERSVLELLTLTFSIIDLENEGRGTRKCFFIGGILDGTEMNK